VANIREGYLQRAFGVIRSIAKTSITLYLYIVKIRRLPEPSCSNSLPYFKKYSKIGGKDEYESIF
jgi:hypothetical protein